MSSGLRLRTVVLTAVGVVIGLPLLYLIGLIIGVSTGLIHFSC